MKSQGAVRVSELFHSIQGESTWAGMPCVFVRLAGCNLRCRWCDTAYAWEGGETRTLPDVVAEAAGYSANLAEITGGEPLLQEATPGLAQGLLDTGKTLLCETNGTLPIDLLPAGVVRIMDIKCPGSGCHEKTDWANIGRLNAHDEVKFVIADRADYDWARHVVTEHGLATRCRAVLFAPVAGKLEPSALAAWILADAVPVRLQMQLHKVIWPGRAEGV